MDSRLLEIVRETVARQFLQIVSITDKTPQLGLVPLEGQLITASLVDDELRIGFVPLPAAVEGRLEHVRSSTVETLNAITVPIGVVFIAEDPTRRGHGADEVILISWLVRQLADITGQSKESITDQLFDTGRAIAEERFRIIMPNSGESHLNN